MKRQQKDTDDDDNEEEFQRKNRHEISIFPTFSFRYKSQNERVSG